MVRKWFLPLMFALLFVLLPAEAEVIWHDASGKVEVVSTTIRDEEWLFLPSCADLSALKLTAGGENIEINWLNTAGTSEDMPSVYSGAVKDTALNVVVSDVLRSLHLQSDDPVNHGRAWIESSYWHKYETPGHIVILGQDGLIDLEQDLLQIRGRGNSTWRSAIDKRPYQFKLTNRADVLQTGLKHEYARTWVLLSNEQDYTQTMLRNQIALDLAKEMGLETSSRCEQVDLYYDGEYRGTYLLAEKVEVGEHSVDVMDFDKLLEPVNFLLRVTPPDEQPFVLGDGTQRPVPDGYAESGFPYGYSDGVYDNKDVSAGGYLLEMEYFGTMSEQAWWELPTGYYMSVKNPEYASETMVRYVEGLFYEALRAMLNHGFHPDTGEPLENFIDIDSFTRSHLVCELMLTSNTYNFSSTYFVLPEEQTRFYAGPLWDFDHAVVKDWPALKDNNMISHAFYRTTVFQRAAKELMKTLVEPMYQNVLFGTQKGAYLKSFEQYKNDLHASWRMNYYRYYANAQTMKTIDSTFESVMDEMEDFLRSQQAFLSEEVAAWGEDEPTHELEVTFLLPYGSAQSKDLVEVVNETHGSLLLHDIHFSCVEPATEEDYGIWEAEFSFEAKPNCEIPEDVVVSINGEEFEGFIVDNELFVTVRYEDPTYRPAVLDGVDYGHVFDYEYYTDSYPELIDEYGDDREAVLTYFRDEGMDMGDIANDFFDPMMIFENITTAANLYGPDWKPYYEAFIQSPGIWMTELDMTYEPELYQE